MSSRFLWLEPLLATICLLASTVKLVSQPAQLRHEVEQIIYYETNVNLKEVGLIIGILDGDSTYILPFDDCEKIIPGGLSDSSVFELGGLSKVFTATICHLLARDKLIELDNVVNEYLPVAYRNKALDDVTVKSLLNHTAGIPKVPLDLGQKISSSLDPYGEYSAADILTYYSSLARNDLNRPYTYSHLNYALLQWIITANTNRSIDQLFYDYISGPMTMDQSTFAVNTAVVPGYDRADRLTPTWQLDAFAGSEGMKSSMQDLQIFIRSLMDPTHDLNRIFKNQVEEQHQIPRSKKTYTADAWHLFRNKKYPDIYLHSGKTSGHGAMIAFVADTRTAVVILTNKVASMNGLGILILRMINDNWKRKKDG